MTLEDRNRRALELGQAAHDNALPPDDDDAPTPEQIAEAEEQRAIEMHQAAWGDSHE